MKISDFLTQHDIGDLSGICALADYLNEINNPLGETLQLTLSEHPDVFKIIHQHLMTCLNDETDLHRSLSHDFEISVYTKEHHTPFYYELFGNCIRFKEPNLQYQTITQIPDFLEEFAVVALLHILYYASTPQFLLGLLRNLNRTDKLLASYLNRLFRAIISLEDDLQSVNASIITRQLTLPYHDTEGYELVIQRHLTQYPNSQVLEDLNNRLTTLVPKLLDYHQEYTPYFLTSLINIREILCRK